MQFLHGLKDVYTVSIKEEDRLYQLDTYKNFHCLDTFIIYGKNVIDNIIFHYRLQNITFKQSKEDPSIYKTKFYNRSKFIKFIYSLSSLEERYGMFIF